MSSLHLFREFCEVAAARSNLVLIVLDYKSKTDVYRGPSTTEDDFFNKRFASHMGFCCFLPGSLIVYIDVLSNIVSQTGYDSHLCLEQCVKQLRQGEDTKDAWKTVTAAEIWTDTGKHFKCHTFTGACFAGGERVGNRVERGIFDCTFLEVMLNSFVTHHGKTRLDGWFAKVAQYLTMHAHFVWVALHMLLRFRARRGGRALIFMRKSSSCEDVACPTAALLCH